MLDLEQKKVIVVGLKLSGVGAANLCARHGASVTVFDLKSAQELQEEASRLDPSVVLKASAQPEEADLEQASLLVLSPAVPMDLAYVQRAKERGIPVWSEIELASRFAKAPMIGITGTNGKTTTTSLVGEICRLYKPASQTAGNIGVSFSELSETVPEDAFLTLELSSFQLEGIDQFHPRAAAILNFSPDHLNRHHTYENYVAAKCRIYENMTAGDVLVLNADDALCMEKAKALAARPGAPKIVTFSHERKQPGGVYTQEGHIMADFNGQTVDVLPVGQMQIFGPHNEENAMAAVALCLYAGIPLSFIQQGLRTFKGVPHRIEPVGQVDGVFYFNDSKATNPDAAIKGLLSMRSEKVVLIGGGFNKGTPYDEWCRLFPGKVRKLILIGETADDIEACALKCGFAKEDILRADSLQSAVKAARACACPGDSVLLSPACASWDMFTSYEERGDLFRDIVKKMIEE